MVLVDYRILLKTYHFLLSEEITTFSANSGKVINVKKNTIWKQQGSDSASFVLLVRHC